MGLQRRVGLAIVVAVAVVLHAVARAQDSAPAAAPAAQPGQLEVLITFLSREEDPLVPLSLAEPTLTDEGIMGARQGLADNQTTGRFLKQSYRLTERVVPRGGGGAAPQ
jgi:hypothetical protein